MEKYKGIKNWFAKIGPEHLVYVILLSLPLYLVRFSVFNIPTTILEIEIYIASLIFFYSIIKKRELGKKIMSFVGTPIFFPWLLFFVAGVASVLISSEKITSMGIFKAYFFDAGLFLFLFLSSIKTKAQIKRCFMVLLGSALALSLIGLAQYIFWPEALQDGRIKSVFSSPNYLSLYIAPLVFFFGGIFKRGNKYIYQNILLALFLLAMVLVTALTFSRGAWLGIILGAIFLIAMFILKNKKLQKLRIPLLLLFSIGFVASFFFITVGAYRFGLVSKDRVYTSDNIRKEIWTTSFEIGKDNWLGGVGLGNFQNYFDKYTLGRINYPEYITPNAVTPHNIFLNVWLQSGLLGIVALFLLIWRFFVLCIKGMANDYTVSTIIVAGMIAILGQGLVDSAIWKNDLIIIFWFFIGSSYIISSKGEKHG